MWQSVTHGQPKVRNVQKCKERKIMPLIVATTFATQPSAMLHGQRMHFAGTKNGRIKCYYLCLSHGIENNWCSAWPLGQS
jgi:hypothetical protein